MKNLHDRRKTSGPRRGSRTFRRGGLRTAALVGVAATLVGALLVVTVLTGSEPRKVDSTAAVETRLDRRLPASPRASATLANRSSSPDRGSTPSASASTSPTGKRFMGSSTILIGGGTERTPRPTPRRSTCDTPMWSAAPRPRRITIRHRVARMGRNWWGCWIPPPGSIVPWRHAQVAKATYKGSPRPQKMFWTWFVAAPLGDYGRRETTLRARSGPSTGLTCSPSI